MPKKKPTPEEKREAAQRRLVSNYFSSNVRSRSTGHQDVTLSAVRVDSALAESIGAYGDNHSLSYSDTVRSLLEKGLEEAEESDERLKRAVTDAIDSYIKNQDINPRQL